MKLLYGIRAVVASFSLAELEDDAELSCLNKVVNVFFLDSVQLATTGLSHEGQRCDTRPWFPSRAADNTFRRPF